MTIFSTLADQFAALRWEQQIGVVALVVAIVALITYVLLVHYELFVRRVLREQSVPVEPLSDNALTFARMRETYCRICRVYLATTETACEHCGTPLILFADAVDMAEHMARTFPLPPPPPATFSTPASKGFGPKVMQMSGRRLH
jgi:hypothetical protein